MFAVQPSEKFAEICLFTEPCKFPGTQVAFLADESNTHRVSEVTRGERLTLTLWFTLLPEHSEDAKVLQLLQQTAGVFAFAAHHDPVACHPLLCHRLCSHCKRRPMIAATRTEWAHLRCTILETPDGDARWRRFSCRCRLPGAGAAALDVPGLGLGHSHAASASRGCHRGGPCIRVWAGYAAVC